MAISSVGSSIISSISSTPSSDSAASALVQSAQKGQEQQPSAIVSLSKQGQQLNNSEAKAAATAQAQNTVGQPNSPAEATESSAKEASEKPGIQFMEGESKGGRVNTFA